MNLDWKQLDVTYSEGGETFVICRPSLVASFYGGDRLSRRAGELLHAWRAHVPPAQSLVFMGPTSRSFRPASGNAYVRLVKDIEGGNGEYLFVKDGEGFDIGSTSIELLLRDAGDAEAIAHAHVAYPIDVAFSSSLDDYRHEFVDLLDALAPLHACLGFGFSMVFGREFEIAALPRLAALCTRYLGFDLPDRYTEKGLRARIKSPAWLTYVDDQMARSARVDQSLSRRAMPVELAIVPVATGKLLIAGERPPIGDRNRGATDISALKDAYRILEPLCLDRWEASPLFGESTVDQLNGWLTRLED